MLTIKTINNNQRSSFGQLIRTHRLLQRMALRDLSKKSMLSHTLLNRIEHAKNPITDASFTKLEQALDVNFLHDTSLNTLFEKEKKKLYDSFYYAQSHQTFDSYRILSEHENYYMKSLKVTDYLMLKMATYIHGQQFDVNDIALEVSILVDIIDLASVDSQSKFFLLRGMYHFLLFEFNQSISDLSKSHELIQEERLIPMIDYFLGRSYSAQYQTNLANTYYQNALAGFEKFTNFRRLIYVRLYIAINQIKMYEYDMVSDELYDVLKLAVRDNIAWVVHAGYIHLMYLAMLQRDYYQALAIGEKITYKSMQYYVLMTYSAYRTNNLKLAKKIIKQSSGAAPELDAFNLYDKAMQYLKLVVLRSDEDEKNIGKILKSFYETSQMSNAFFELELAYEVYREFLVEQRRYKEAYALTNEMIQIVQKTIQ